MGQVVAVGTNPVGVAANPIGGTAAVANAGSNNASVVDDINADVTATVSTDNGPTGVTIDPGLGDVAVANSGANTVSVFAINAATGAATRSIPVMQGPSALAVDPATHNAAVGNLTAGNVSLVSITGTTATLQTNAGGIQIPQGIAVDPCGASSCSNSTPSANFLITASLQNQAVILDQLTGTLTSLRVGINPTSIAYNFRTSTLVTTNSLGQSMTVVDFLTRQVRSVFRMTPASQFSVDIHPLTNLAVVSDSKNKRILLLPLPQ
jgi:YVTN family beta-propeller protein